MNTPKEKFNETPTLGEMLEDSVKGETTGEDGGDNSHLSDEVDGLDGDDDEEEEMLATSIGEEEDDNNDPLKDLPASDTLENMKDDECAD